MWSENFHLLGELYSSVSDIQNYFKYIIKNMKQ